MKANTTPLAPHNATFGKKNQFTSPVTSAVIPMTSNIFEGPYFSSSVGPREGYKTCSL